MTTDPFSYADVRAAVESGIFVAFAAGTRQGKPELAWCAAVLDGRSAAVAHSSNEDARAAQGVGAVLELRRHARHHGFTPV